MMAANFQRKTSHHLDRVFRWRTYLSFDRDNDPNIRAAMDINEQRCSSTKGFEVWPQQEPGNADGY
jgi:hypothetical protein